MNTLVSSVAANGAQLTAGQWRQCLCGVVLPLARRVAAATAAASQSGGSAAAHEVT